MPGTGVPAVPPTTMPDHRTVTVQPGDSLWLIAAQRMGPSARPAQIAAAWPAWYRANAATIGPDPRLIQPGQVLSVPDSMGSP